MRILGLDPSSVATGYGLIETDGNNHTALAYGAIKPSRKVALPARLLEIKTGIDRLISKYAPDEVAVENPFYGLNIKTAITLGQVRGAVLVAAAGAAIPLSEYSPLEIKKAVTGYGQAEKGQVGMMVRALLGIDDEAMEEDAADALACAFCHLNARLARKNLEENVF